MIGLLAIAVMLMFVIVVELGLIVYLIYMENHTEPQTLMELFDPSKRNPGILFSPHMMGGNREPLETAVPTKTGQDLTHL